MIELGLSAKRLCAFSALLGANCHILVEAGIHPNESSTKKACIDRRLLAVYQKITPHPL
jgi:hypothetical protein